MHDDGLASFFAGSGQNGCVHILWTFMQQENIIMRWAQGVECPALNVVVLWSRNKGVAFQAAPPPPWSCGFGWYIQFSAWDEFGLQILLSTSDCNKGFIFFAVPFALLFAWSVFIPCCFFFSFFFLVSRYWAKFSSLWISPVGKCLWLCNAACVWCLTPDIMGVPCLWPQPIHQLKNLPLLAFSSCFLSSAS